MSDSRRLMFSEQKDDDMKTLMIIDVGTKNAYSEDFTAWNSWNNSKSLQENVAVYDSYDIYLVHNSRMWKPTSFVKNGNNLYIYFNSDQSSTSVTALLPLTSYPGFKNGDPRSNY